jgi:hypothetical protein
MADYIPNGGSGSNTLSTSSINDLDGLLIGLADNASNLIVAKDIRDSVYTLWDRIDTVSVTASLALAASGDYTNLNPVPTTVGGVTAGTTFNGMSMSAVFDMLFYPYTQPLSTLTTNNNPREYGSSTNVVLSWSITKKSENIFTTYPLLTPDPVPNGGSGTYSTVGTHSITPGVSTVNSFTMSVYDDLGGPYITTGTLTWMNKIYWGATNNATASLIAMSDTTMSNLIKGLTGCYVGGGNELSTTKSKTYTGINAEGGYLIFAWPSNVSNSYSPTFNVNGLESTAFTRVKTNFTFTNSNGFSGTNYEVWTSNTVQNSGLNIIIT